MTQKFECFGIIEFIELVKKKTNTTALSTFTKYLVSNFLNNTFSGKSQYPFLT